MTEVLARPGQVNAGTAPARTEPPGKAPGASVLSCVLLAGGLFTLVLALLLPFAVYPRLAVYPADPQALLVQQATGATALVPDLTAPAGARVLKDVNLEIATYISQAGRADSESVVWRVATSTSVAGRGMINARYENVSLDRKTGLTNNCCDDRLFTDEGDTLGTPLSHSGYLTFPLNTRKQDYRLWDIQLRRTRDATYQGQERRDGFATYRFLADTPLTRIGYRELPGSLFGVSDPSVVAAEDYADQRTFWVEPNTGNVVAVHETLRQQFSYAGRTVIAVAADLNSKSMSKTLRDRTRQAADILPWVRGRASWILALAGAGLLYGSYRVRHRM